MFVATPLTSSSAFSLTSVWCCLWSDPDLEPVGIGGEVKSQEAPEVEEVVEQEEEEKFYWEP